MPLSKVVVVVVVVVVGGGVMPFPVIYEEDGRMRIDKAKGSSCVFRGLPDGNT